MRALAIMILAAGCTPGGTRVRLDVKYDDSWQLDGVQVAPSPHPEVDAKMAHQLLLLVPDDSGAISIDLWGLHGSERRAWGHAEVTPLRGREVRQSVTLTQLPCGAWCHSGATDCQGAATVVCIESADGCTDWSAPTACPSDTPFCSFGACGATCRDECAAGEERCDGATGVRVCAKGADHCLHWQAALACPAGQVCSNGACAATCSDECAAGAASCLSGGIITCGDSNHDGCLEWSPIVPCESGASCSNGQCSTTCTDDCTTNVCSGLTYRMCGQFGPDSCNHLSAGTSCVSSDPCMAGSCTDSGCQSAPLACDLPSAANCPACQLCGGQACNTPPAATCTTPTTLRTYQSSGACASGVCSYASSDTTCPTCYNGACCQPDCTAKACGADDGCGALCTKGCWLSAASLPTPRFWSAAATGLDGRIYVMGGIDTLTNSVPMNVVEEYTPGRPGTAGSWRTVAPMGTPRYAFAATTGPDGRIYAIGTGGGSGSLSSSSSPMEVYTPGAPGSPGSWVAGPSLPQETFGEAVATGGDGRIYAFGGYAGQAVYAYTPDASAWVSVASLNSTHHVLCGALGSDGRIYAIGGETLAVTTVLSMVEAYTLGPSGSWTSAASLSSARAELGCASSGADGRIYAAGGQDSGDNALATVEAYTPTTNLWATAPSMTAPRFAHSVVAGIDGRIYAFGGLDTARNTLGSVEVYTP